MARKDSLKIGSELVRNQKIQLPAKGLGLGSWDYRSVDDLDALTLVFLKEA